MGRRIIVNFRTENELHEAYERAKANLEIEGFTFSEKDEQRIKDVIRGIKTKKQIIEEIKEEYHSSGGAG